MEPVISFLLVFAVGVVASFIGAISGGGGLLSIPFLMFMGLPPQVAIATNKCGAVGLMVGIIPKFWKAKKILWTYVLPFSVISLIATFLGTQLLIQTPNELLEPLVGVLLLILLPLLLLKKEVGTRRRETSRLQKGIGFILYFAVVIFGAFFGGGAGTLIFYTIVFFFGFTMLEANATDAIPWFLLSIISLGIYAWYGLVNWTYGLTLLAGMYVGGYMGAHTALKKGDVWVKSFFAVIVVCSALKLLFF